MSAHRYNVVCELATAMVTGSIHENHDNTVFLYFENEHAEYGITVSHEEARELASHIMAAAESAQHNERFPNGIPSIKDSLATSGSEEATG